jgi:hypothetical protein
VVSPLAIAPRIVAASNGSQRGRIRQRYDELFTHVILALWISILAHVSARQRPRPGEPGLTPSIRPPSRHRALPGGRSPARRAHAPWPRGSGARSGRPAATAPRQRPIAAANALRASSTPATRRTGLMAPIARPPGKGRQLPIAGPRSGRPAATEPRQRPIAGLMTPIAAANALRVSPTPATRRTSLMAPIATAAQRRRREYAPYGPRQRPQPDEPASWSRSPPPRSAEGASTRPTGLADARDQANRPHLTGRTAKPVSAVRQAHQRQRPAPARQRQESSYANDHMRTIRPYARKRRQLLALQATHERPNSIRKDLT